MRALEAQAAAEVHAMARCDALAQRVADPMVSLLLGMIVEDTERHHTLLQSIIHQVREESGVAVSPSRALERTEEAPETLTSDRETVSGIRVLISNEHEAARRMRNLALEEDLLYGGLRTLLLETIARDNEKHAAILRYVLRRVEDASGRR
jgi:rubrerythrin